MRCLAIAIVASLAFVPLRAAAQRSAPDLGCVAASEQDDLWPGRDSVDLANPLITGVEAFARRVAGKYRVLLITTEGAGIGKRATEATAVLRFQRADSGMGPMRQNHGRFQMDLRIRRYGYLHQPLKPAARNTRAYWTGVYNAPNGFHFVDADPNETADRYTINEAAAGYYVSTVDDSVGMIRGRWSASFLMVPQRTPVGTLTESRGGYFCAWRVNP